MFYLCILEDLYRRPKYIHVVQDGKMSTSKSGFNGWNIMYAYDVVF